MTPLRLIMNLIPFNKSLTDVTETLRHLLPLLPDAWNGLGLGSTWLLVSQFHRTWLFHFSFVHNFELIDQDRQIKEEKRASMHSARFSIIARNFPTHDIYF